MDALARDRVLALAGIVAPRVGTPAGETDETRSHPHPGQHYKHGWIPIDGELEGVVRDALKLDGKIDLQPGETLVGSSKVKADLGTIQMAATETHGIRSLRLGIGDESFGAEPWRGSNPDVAAENARRARLRAERDALEAEPLAAQTPASEKRYAQLETMDLSDVYVSGYTASLDSHAAAQLGTELTAGIAKAQQVKAVDDARWNEIGRLQAEEDKLSEVRDPLVDKYRASTISPQEDAELDRLTARWTALTDRIDALTAESNNDDLYRKSQTEGTVPGQWADVHYQTYVDDPEQGVQVVLGAVPHGSTLDDLGDSQATLDAAEAQQFLKQLQQLTGPTDTVRALVEAFGSPELRYRQSDNTGTGGSGSGPAPASKQDQSKHPHVASGPKGGQFTSKGGGGSKAAPKPKAAPAAQSVPQAPATPRTMKQGDSGEDVRYAQYAMSLLGFHVNQNGTYDAQTAAAVKEIQSRLGMAKPNGHLSAAQLHKLQDAVRLSPCVGQSRSFAQDLGETRDLGDGECRHRSLVLLGIPVRPLPRDDDNTIDDETRTVLDAISGWIEQQFDEDWDERAHDVTKELRIPGGKGGGRWTKNPIGKAISDALDAWGKGKGPDDPFTFDGKPIDREPLRKAAVARGITLKRGASRDDIVHALLGGVRDEVKTQRAERQKRLGSSKFSIDVGGKVDPEAAREVEVENKIRAAYADLLAEKPNGANRRLVNLADLRERLAEENIRGAEVDMALKRLITQPGVNIIPESNQSALTPRLRSASARIGGQDKHHITIADTSPRPLPTPVGGKRIDVAVYTGTDPNAPSLREISSANRPGRVITSQPDLTGLEKWANDHGHTDVAQWAAGERARKEAKSAPRTHQTDTGGRITEAEAWKRMHGDKPMPAKAAKKAAKSAPKQAAPGSTWETLAARQSEVAKSAASPVVDRQQFGGFRGGTTRETHADGSVTIHKHFTDVPDATSLTAERQADAEVLASFVAAAVGVRAPAVRRTGPTDIDMEFVPGEHIEHSPLTPWKEPPAALVKSDGGELLGLLDLILNNPERHAGNFLVTADGNPVALDHGSSFGRHASSGIGYFAGDFVDGNDWAAQNHMSPDDMSQIRSRLESLRPEFDRLGRSAWWDTMMENFGILESRAAGDRRRLSPDHTVIGDAVPAKSATKALPDVPRPPSVGALFAQQGFGPPITYHSNNALKGADAALRRGDSPSTVAEALREQAAALKRDPLSEGGVMDRIGRSPAERRELRNAEAARLQQVADQIEATGLTAPPAKKAASKAVKSAPGAAKGVPGAPSSPTKRLTAADRAQVSKVASAFHEDWRKTRLQSDGSFEPRVKTTTDPYWIAAHGTHQVDIANTAYADLPNDWKAENRDAAEVAQRILKDHGGTVDLTDEKTRLAVGEQIHQAWLSRENNSYAKGGPLDVPFADLPRDEQDKDTDQLRVAMGALTPAAPAKRAPKVAGPKASWRVSRNAAFGITTHTTDRGHVSEFKSDVRGGKPSFRAYRGETGGSADFESLPEAKAWVAAWDGVTPGETFYGPPGSTTSPAERLKAERVKQDAADAARIAAMPPVPPVVDMQKMPLKDLRKLAKARGHKGMDYADRAPLIEKLLADGAGGARPKGEGLAAIRSSAPEEAQDGAMEDVTAAAKAVRSRQMALLGTRALGHDVTPGHDELHHWWTKGPGLARWIGSPHQYTTLHAELVKATKGKLPPGEIDRMAASWVREVTGFWPGSDMHRVLEGGKPRGNRIGRG